jgi:hypothetical protein
VRVEQLRQAQRDAVIDAGIDAAQLELALTALQLFPHAFPQLTQMITGQAPTTTEFVAGQTRFFTAFAAWVSAGDGPSAEPERADRPARGSKPRLRQAGSVTAVHPA